MIAESERRKMAGTSRARNSNFDRPKQYDRSDYNPIDETQTKDHIRAASLALREARYPQLYTESTSESSHGSANDFGKLEANSAKNVIIPRYILVMLVVVVIVTFMVCVTLLMIILLTMMPQNVSDAAKEGNVFILYVQRSSPVERPINLVPRCHSVTGN